MGWFSKAKEAAVPARKEPDLWVLYHKGEEVFRSERVFAVADEATRRGLMLLSSWRRDMAIGTVILNPAEAAIVAYDITPTGTDK